MKRLMVLAGLLGILVAASPAQAHRWSYENALNDARWSILQDCGGGWFGCEVRYTPYLSPCTEHSWCWGQDHVRQYIEFHTVTQYKHSCHQHAKQYHGGVYVDARDICGPMYAKTSARRAGWRPNPGG